MRILKTYHPLGRIIFSEVTKVETPDPYIAVLTLAHPAPMIMASLAGFISPIVPKHLMTRVTRCVIPPTVLRLAPAHSASRNGGGAAQSSSNATLPTGMKASLYVDRLVGCLAIARPGRRH